MSIKIFLEIFEMFKLYFKHQRLYYQLSQQVEQARVKVRLSWPSLAQTNTKKMIFNKDQSWSLLRAMVESSRASVASEPSLQEDKVDQYHWEWNNFPSRPGVVDAVRCLSCSAWCRLCSSSTPPCRSLRCCMSKLSILWSSCSCWLSRPRGPGPGRGSSPQHCPCPDCCSWTTSPDQPATEAGHLTRSLPSHCYWWTKCCSRWILTKLFIVIHHTLHESIFQQLLAQLSFITIFLALNIVNHQEIKT